MRRMYKKHCNKKISNNNISMHKIANDLQFVEDQ